MLVRVVAPHFVAGFIMAGDRCEEAAPIIKWFIGKSGDYIREQCRKRGWKASVVSEPHVAKILDNHQNLVT